MNGRSSNISNINQINRPRILYMYPCIVLLHSIANIVCARDALSRRCRYSIAILDVVIRFASFHFDFFRVDSVLRMLLHIFCRIFCCIVVALHAITIIIMVLLQYRIPNSKCRESEPLNAVLLLFPLQDHGSSNTPQPNPNESNAQMSRPS